MTFILDGMIHHYQIEIAFVSVTQQNWEKDNHNRGQQMTPDSSQDQKQAL